MAKSMVSSLSYMVHQPRRSMPRLLSTSRFRIALILSSICFLILYLQPSIKGHYAVPAQQRQPPVAPQTQAQAQQPERAETSKPLTAVLQNFYVWKKDKTAWEPHHAAPNVDGQRLRSSTFLITWNLDHTAPNLPGRVDTAISHIRSLLVTSSDTIVPSVIAFQEVSPEALEQLANSPFIRNNFHMSDCTSANVLWSNKKYGTITLVDKRLRVNAAFRVHYSDTSLLGRDVLFVDLEMKSFSATDGKKIRIGNTHLESPAPPGPNDWQIRNKQLKLASLYMRDGNMQGAVLAGDMHASHAEDTLFPEENGLRDAHAESGWKYGDPDSYTYGFQSKKEVEKGRWDKFFMIGYVKIEDVRRIGEGLKVKGEQGAYVSDHFGVMGTLRVL